jgi:hypothetical protein
MFMSEDFIHIHTRVYIFPGDCTTPIYVFYFVDD